MWLISLLSVDREPWTVRHKGLECLECLKRLNFELQTSSSFSSRPPKAKLKKARKRQNHLHQALSSHPTDADHGESSQKHRITYIKPLQAILSKSSTRKVEMVSGRNIKPSSPCDKRLTVNGKRTKGAKKGDCLRKQSPFLLPGA